MGRIDKTVFISYRRTNFPWALAIFQDLTQHGYDVFFDFLGINAGDFESVIIENIKARAHFVVLLTPSALERCGEPGDWLRREIETALEVKRNIIPLMLENFDFGAPGIGSQLTGDLEALKSYNGLRVPPEYFLEAMGRLRDKYLSITLDAVLHPASRSAKQAAVDQKVAAGDAPPVGEKELTAVEWYERGFDSASPEEQMRCFSEAIRLSPDYAAAFYNRGVARKNQGDLDGALQDWSEAIRLKPDIAYPFNNRGSARQEKGDLNGALLDLNEAIRLKPDYAYALCNRGSARQEKGDLDGALLDFNEAIRLKPDYAVAFSNRGYARYAKGDLNGALEDYNDAILLKPDYPVALNNRGMARYAKGDLEGALEDFDKAICLKPDTPEIFTNRGAARTGKGNLDGALQDYHEAIRLKPDHAIGFYNRAGLRKAQGDRQGAAADYQKYLDLGGGLREGNQVEVEKMIRDLKNPSAN